MRLTRIKLAGFKSFVDPTDIRLPSSLVGIVGPNGCGKSNTIDAVRWVMGESSAKHLRGESMDDVIFSGSSQRKPVGQASVELIFDNSEGKLGGEYARYGEIAIKREVTREGQSRYLLNNVRCRRRDIRDIFLGTGLGPRSYAIIEQGMVSRLIEAKPEDMRVYVEEAAGISKYKERRRETETRIRHTRDNLDRLDDLREEVDKQLVQLQRQASAAEKYETLREQLKRTRGELLLLKRRRHQHEHEHRENSVAQQQQALDAVIVALHSAEQQIDLARGERTQAGEALSRAQAEYYRLGSEVSRIEQSIEHLRDTRRAQNEELDDIERGFQEARVHVEADSARIVELDQALEADLPRFEALEADSRQSAAVLVAAEQALVEARAARAAWQQNEAETRRQAGIEEARAQQLERTLGSLRQRLSRLEQEEGQQASAGLSAILQAAEVAVREAFGEEQRLRGELDRSQGSQQRLREQLRSARHELDARRTSLQEARGRLASLEALQQAALEGGGDAREAWLELHELSDAPRLGQQIEVVNGWEKAAELVLGQDLDAVCIDDPELIERCLSDAPAAQLQLIHAVPGTGSPAADRLASKINGAGALHSRLQTIHLAEDVSAALAMRDRLQADESVITPEGFWLAPHWLRIAGADSEDSVLLREKTIAELQRAIESLQGQVQQGEASVDSLSAELNAAEQSRDTLQEAFNAAVRVHSARQGELGTQRQAGEQLDRERSRVAKELVEVRTQLDEEQAALQIAQAARDEARRHLEAMQQEGAALQQALSQAEEQQQQARERHESEQSEGRALAVRVESMKSSRAATVENLERMQSRVQQLSARRDALHAALAAAEEDQAEQDPLSDLEAELETIQQARSQADANLQSTREQVQAIEQRMREQEHQRQQQDVLANKARDALQAVRMAGEEARVRLKTIDEQFAEQDFDVSALEAGLAEDAREDTWQAESEQLEKAIQRLGPINLAAIDQLAEAAERKEYLDSQHDDVTEALATLEQAIARIDKETRQRFRDTYEQVNAKFTEFFPRLFGGGNAELKLAGDDLLTTGVEVIAQPPGKRVSSIQLLSGGEKALTAVALVFAFFELNPSPFCMLDEVDAPLDDANVGRFCELVKQMSERVQFMVITHNKVTMEMADQLMGVTMNEPGVSRLVSVDVQEAVELAGV